MSDPYDGIPWSDPPEPAFPLPIEFSCTAEEYAIYQRWGKVFAALESGAQLPQTKRQELFLEEITGKIYPVSISAILWLRYKAWRAESDTRGLERLADRERAAARPRASSKSANGPTDWYAKWLAEHQFDDFR
jgi:uncharacterized protein YifE (UPF0438 family)